MHPFASTKPHQPNTTTTPNKQLHHQPNPSTARPSHLPANPPTQPQTNSFSADACRDPLLQALRKEIYVAPYDGIDWDAERHSCSPLDVYDPVTGLMKGLQAGCLVFR